MITPIHKPVSFQRAQLHCQTSLSYARYQSAKLIEADRASFQIQQDRWLPFARDKARCGGDRAPRFLFQPLTPSNVADGIELLPSIHVVRSKILRWKFDREQTGIRR